MKKQDNNRECFLRDKQQIVADYFESHGIPVEARFIRGGLSIYAKGSKRPIARFVPTGSKSGVEVMWFSHRDKWDHIGDFGGVTMSFDEALEYVVSDAPSCFCIDFLMMERSRI